MLWSFKVAGAKTGSNDSNVGWESVPFGFESLCSISNSNHVWNESGQTCKFYIDIHGDGRSGLGAWKADE